MSIKRLFGVLARVALSVLLAGIFYTAWMVMGLPIFKAEVGGRVVRAGIWILGPIMTGAGFAIGPVIFGLLAKDGKSRFWDIYKWSLVGCAIGGGGLPLYLVRC